jgi:hypothetical protein
MPTQWLIDRVKAMSTQLNTFSGIIRDPNTKSFVGFSLGNQNLAPHFIQSQKVLAFE